MALDFSRTLVVGVSASALFDLRSADAVFRDHGVRAYRQHMVATERDHLAPGTAFSLVRALLSLNEAAPAGAAPLAEVVVLSRNSTETGVRVMNAVRAHGLPITRYAFTGGEPLAGYATAFGVDLFLSSSAEDVQRLVDAEACAAAVLQSPPDGYQPAEGQVRFAFDGDAVLFSDEAEILYKREGLHAFHAAEHARRDVPLGAGPFAAFLKKLARVKEGLPEGVEYAPIRLAVVTARNAPAEARVITTLRAWNVYVDEAFFLGGLPKGPVLSAFRPHIFFDDQDAHVVPAAAVVPTGRVLYRSDSPLHRGAPLAPDGGRVPLTRSPADDPAGG
jgi:5'-nucleotidase